SLPSQPPEAAGPPAQEVQPAIPPISTLWVGSPEPVSQPAGQVQPGTLADVGQPAVGGGADWATAPVAALWDAFWGGFAPTPVQAGGAAPSGGEPAVPAGEGGGGSGASSGSDGGGGGGDASPAAGAQAALGAEGGQGQITP